MKRLLYLLLLLIPLPLFSQGIPISGILLVGPNGQPRAGATISFCTHPANALPCTNYANIYTDIALTILINQAATPFKTDGLGNCCVIGTTAVQPYAAPNIIDYTVSGAGVTVPNGPYVIDVPPATNGNNTWTGSNNFTGNLTAGNVNNTLYVGGSVTNWTGADIGAQLNSAYAALPATGGTLLLVPQASGLCYNYSIPISFSTVGKYVVLQGLAPSTSTNANPGGACLNYTPTTATSALTLDWTPNTGGGFAMGGGLRDITFINNLCSTQYTGCGSSATGLRIGPVNGGAHSAEFSNVRIIGFGTGIAVPDAGGASWGMIFRNLSLVDNLIGYNQAKPEEAIAFREPKIIFNGTGMNFAGSGGDLTVVGGSIDSNSTCGVQTNAISTNLFFYGTHWENLGIAGDVKFVCGSASNIEIYGGNAGNDNVAGASASWFTNSNFVVSGLQLVSLGATLSGTLFNVGSQADISVFDNTTTPIPPDSIAFIGGGTKVKVLSQGGRYQAVTGGSESFVEGTAVSGISGQDRCYGDSTAHAIMCSNNNDTFSRVMRYSDPTLTLKKGSGGGNITSASTTYVVADSANLCYTITIPIGWKLGISASGNLGTSTAIVFASAALTDNAACITANSGILVERQVSGQAIGATEPFALNWVITGDGNQHSVGLQFKTSNASDSALLLNSSATLLPVMNFELMPSN